jgi:glucose-1-phosphatase
MFCFGIAILHICNLFFYIHSHFFMANLKIIPFGDQQPEAIIFDLGGVLLNIDLQKSIDAFRQLGFENVEEKISRIFSKNTSDGAAGIFQLYETGEITSAQFRDGIREYAGRELSDQEIDTAWTAMILNIPPAKIRLLEQLGKTYKLYLLSNTNAIHIETLTANSKNGGGYSDLVSCFDKVYYSFELKLRKPDVSIYNHVIEDAGLDPGNTLFIDDADPNIEGAKAAGLITYFHQRNADLDGIFGNYSQ